MPTASSTEPDPDALLLAYVQATLAEARLFGLSVVLAFETAYTAQDDPLCRPLPF